jgi:hypothetical protein
MIVLFVEQCTWREHQPFEAVSRADRRYNGLCRATRRKVAAAQATLGCAGKVAIRTGGRSLRARNLIPVAT